MCSVENILKISNILKVNPGKLGYNADKVNKKLGYNITIYKFK